MRNHKATFRSADGGYAKTPQSAGSTYHTFLVALCFQLLGRDLPRSADAVGYHGALRAALALPDAQLPSAQPAHDGPPPAKAWERSAPEAAARLAAARPAVAAIADEHLIPVENLLSPDLLRRLCWAPPDEIDDATVAGTLGAGRARPWQVELTAHVIGSALRREAGRPAAL